MCSHRHEIFSRRADFGAEWAAHPHLPCAQHAREQEGAERHPEMRKAKSLSVAHRKLSHPGPV